MPQTKAFKIGYGIIIILLIIYLSTLVDFIFQPIVILIQTLFFPFLIAGVLYYLFRPIVNFLHRRKVPKVMSILVIYLAAIGIVVAAIFVIGPILQRQVTSLVQNMPLLINEIRLQITLLQENEWFTRLFENGNFSIEELSRKMTQYINEAVSIIGTNVAALLGFIANVVVIFIVIPFILFYMLKEGEKAPQQVLRFLPEKQRIEGNRILKDMDLALSSYIQGQIFVSFCVGVLMYIGFLIIGIEYSLILALVAMFTNVIPFVGPWIGTIPGVIVAFIHSPLMVVKLLIVVVIVQQIESNFISPQVMGKKLAIHPLTIILLLLVAGGFGGLLGLLIAVPTYAVLKVVVSHTYRLIKLRNASR